MVREAVANLISGGEMAALRGEVAALDWHHDWVTRENRELRAAGGSLHVDLNEAGFSAPNGGPQSGPWVEMGASQGGEPSRADLGRLIERSRAMCLYNPLIKRAVRVASFYTFGKGLTFSSPQTKAAVALREFWSDLDNSWACDANGMAALDRELSETGNLFFTFFVSPGTGRTVLRLFFIEEIADVIRSEHDRFSPQFYARTYSKSARDERGRLVTKIVTELYPDWRHNPAAKPPEIDGHAVNWDVKVLHVKTGGKLGWKFGAPELLAGLDWARGYSKFLQDRASVASALAKFVAKARTGIKGAVGAVKAKIAGATGRGPSEADGAGRGGSTAGNVAALGGDADYEAINVRGATIDPDEGRRLLLMAACDAGLPETMYGDVSVGTLATATSLDQPTKYLFVLRQEFWKANLALIGLIVLLNKARTRNSGLSVTYQATTPIVREGAGQNAEPVTVDIDFPPLLEHEVDKRMDAIDKAEKFLPGVEGKKILARQALSALGEDDIESVIKKLDFSTPAPTPVPPTVEEKIDEKAGEAGGAA